MRDQYSDFLHAMAVLIVMGRHVKYFPFWHQIGWMGVDLFFATF